MWSSVNSAAEDDGEVLAVLVAKKSNSLLEYDV